MLNVSKLFKSAARTKSISLFFMTFLTPWMEVHSQEGVIVDTYVVWESPPGAVELLSGHQYTPLCHYNNCTYFVWIDSAYRPWVTKINKLAVQTVPLDNNPDYTVTPDSHYRFSMGIDKKGYIHITGDMHNYTSLLTTPYPPRYQKQTIMYWKSVNPEDVTGGFAFTGGKGASTALPATGFTYGRFFTDNNNELYYSSRVKAIDSGHRTGEMALGLYRYHTDTLTWTSIGGKAETTRPGNYYDVLLWENGGMAPDGWYQGFLTKIQFDNKNTLHMAAGLNSDPTLTGNDVIVYAYSNDSGSTWYKTNGQQISHLPMRAQNGLSNQAEIVNHTTVEPFFDTKSQVAADRNGKPGIIVGPFYEKDESGWDSSTNKFYLADTIDTDKAGNAVFTISGSAKILYAESFDSRPFGYDFTGFNQYQCLDSYSLRNTGIFYGIGIKSTGNTQTILKTMVNAAPLPDGWHGQDIAAVPTNFDGTSGYRNCQFVVNNYGGQTDSPNDGVYYVYRTLTGDGTITARVSLQGPNANSRAGVMMRETLDPNSRDINTLIAPNKSAAVFGFRTTAGAYPGNAWTNNIAGANWVRLTRKGDVFTSLISKDGEEWIQIGTRNVKLATTLYVGLASASYHPFYIQNTTYDFVSVSQ